MRTHGRRIAPATAGNGSLISFLVAAGVFTVAFGVVMDTSLHSSQAVPAEADQALDISADRLAQTLFGSGVGWYSSLSCTSGTPDPAKMQGDGLDRLGLGREPCPGARGPAFDLSFEKIQNLNNGKLLADAANGFVDYPEAKASLGSQGRDFHLRSWPVLADVRTLLATSARDPNERVAYIGAYTTLVGAAPQTYKVQAVCGKTDGATSIDLWVDITNNGTTSADFEVEFGFHLQAGEFQFPQHTGVVAAGATTRVTAKIPKTADWNWGGQTPKFTADISDSIRGLGSCNASLAGITMTAAATTRLLVVRADKLETILSGASVAAKVRYSQYDGKGNELNAPTTGSIEIQNLLGIPVATDSSLNSRGWETFTIGAPLSYQAVLKSTLGIVLWSDTLNVLTATAGPFTPAAPVTGYEPGAGVVPETTYIAALVADFSPRVYSSAYASATMPYAAGGDVYPDLKSVLNNDVAGQLTDALGAPTLSNYNILIVGSGVDHNAMTSAAAKQTIRDWVFAGGYLIVEGSAQQAVNWLQPIFHSAISSASSPLVTPDATHPLLHTPNELAYASFDDQGRAWDYNSGAEAYFNHVIASGANDVLSVSNTGAFGQGRVLLTSYEPWDLLGTGATGSCAPATLADDCPALQLIHNFLTFSYRELYLDYGAPLPEGRGVGVVERLATVRHPVLAQDVQLVVLVYVF